MFTANSAVTNYFGQSLCLYSVKNVKYCFNSWFIHSVCLSICRWNAINNLISIPNILFNSFVNSTVNCGSLLLIILSGNPCNFYILFLNNINNSSADVPSVVATKYAIFDNQSHTTNIMSFPAANSNLVIKSTVKCVYSFSGISFIINFTASTSIPFFIL